MDMKFHLRYKLYYEIYQRLLGDVHSIKIVVFEHWEYTYWFFFLCSSVNFRHHDYMQCSHKKNILKIKQVWIKSNEQRLLF